MLAVHSSAGVGCTHMACKLRYLKGAELRGLVVPLALVTGAVLWRLRFEDKGRRASRCALLGGGRTRLEMSAVHSSLGGGCTHTFRRLRSLDGAATRELCGLQRLNLVAVALRWQLRFVVDRERQFLFVGCWRAALESGDVSGAFELGSRLHSHRPSWHPMLV
jgi:hypothetical protein